MTLQIVALVVAGLVILALAWHVERSD